jgi:hypothetical protein
MTRIFGLIGALGARHVRSNRTISVRLFDSLGVYRTYREAV